MHRNDLITIAIEVLVPPGEFGERNFSGPDHIGETHMLSITMSRDSDALDRSNFSVISKDMLARFPDDCEILHASHWAVGWVDQLVVRVLTTDYKPAMPADWKFTEAFETILEWSNALADYPVADEMDYSEKEHEEFCEWLDSVMGSWVEDDDGISYDPRNPDTLSADLASLLFEEFDAKSPDDAPADDEIRKLAINRGLMMIDPDSVRSVMDDQKKCIEALEARLDNVGEIMLDIDRGIATMEDLTNLLREDF